MAGLEWQDPAFADEWVARDVLKDLLDLPRRIASVVVGQDRAPTRITDIGSGPGDFLARFLEDFPDAHGTWTDASDAMMHTARARLTRFGDRVDYRIAYMEDLTALPGDQHVVLTSRATHHLSPDGLADFYASAAAKLAPGGWLVNLDHMGVDDTWEIRLKSARRALIPPSSRPGEHPHVHDRPRPSMAEHFDGMHRAGFDDVAVPWRAFATALLMARRPG